MESDHIRTNPAYPDSANRDPALRSRALKGLTILQGFRRDGEGWSGGTIYNPEDGGTYKATVTLADANTLKLKGCIVWPLCKTQTWKRLPEEWLTSHRFHAFSDKTDPKKTNPAATTAR
jgi:uncharacterized protein (DUF2147 family)